MPVQFVQLIQLPLQFPLHLRLQAVWQDPEHVLRQVPEQSPQVFLHDCTMAGAATAITAIPKMGKVFFAASLKNSLLFLSSFFIINALVNYQLLKEILFGI